MNIIATTFVAGTMSIMPLAATPQITANITLASAENTGFEFSRLIPPNPVEGVHISVAGIGLDIDEKGVRANTSGDRDMVIELKLTSGTPIRVRL